MSARSGLPAGRAGRDRRFSEDGRLCRGTSPVVLGTGVHVDGDGGATLDPHKRIRIPMAKDCSSRPHRHRQRVIYSNQGHPPEGCMIHLRVGLRIGHLIGENRVRVLKEGIR